MGAWGESVFENDTAGDWADQFENDAVPSIVTEAIAEALNSDDPDERVSAVALAAAEVIAASRGNPCRGLSIEIKSWIAKTKFQADDQLAELAAKVTVQIADCSELAELWQHASTWRRGLENLRDRLQSPVKPVKYRLSPTGKNAALRAAKKAILEIGGYMTVERSGYTRLLLDGCMTDEQWIGFLVSHSSGLSGMREVSIASKKITDRSLQEFHRLPMLKRVYLDRSSVTDTGMLILHEMPGLRDLSLADTSVTDVGLLALAGTSLRCVAVQKSAITEEGVKRFQQRMPDCFVGPSWEWPHKLLD